MEKTIWTPPKQPKPSIDFLGNILCRFAHDGGAGMNLIRAQIEYIEGLKYSPQPFPVAKLLNELAKMEQNLNNLQNNFDVLVNVYMHPFRYSETVNREIPRTFPLLDEFRNSLQLLGLETVNFKKCSQCHDFLELLLFALGKIADRKSMQLKCIFSGSHTKEWVTLELSKTDYDGIGWDHPGELIETLEAGADHFGFEIDRSILQPTKSIKLVYAEEIKVGNII
ncbi:hypothetical protein N9491_06095 [Planktomarina temperata]|nr:hypothetical protein [Planktomarina temperata]